MLSESLIWNEIQEIDQEDICKRTIATIDNRTNSIRIRIIDEEYAIKIQNRKIEKILQERAEETTDWMLRLLILQYIINAKIPTSNRLRSPYEFKGGDLFFSAPAHFISYESLLQRFRSPNEFLNAGLSLGGRQIQFADAAFELKLLPRVTIAYLLWIGDEEFPSRISVLFNETAEQQLPIDALWVSILMVNRRLSQ